MPTHNRKWPVVLMGIPARDRQVQVSLKSFKMMHGRATWLLWSVTCCLSTSPFVVQQGARDANWDIGSVGGRLS